MRWLFIPIRFGVHRGKSMKVGAVHENFQRSPSAGCEDQGRLSGLACCGSADRAMGQLDAQGREILLGDLDTRPRLTPKVLFVLSLINLVDCINQVLLLPFVVLHASFFDDSPSALKV